MTTQLYDLTVPVFTRGLNNLAAILEKGRAFAAEKGIDPADLIGARLVEDMAALPAQVQRATDSAKGAIVRLGQLDNIVLEDNETSFADLQARIAKTIAFIGAAPRDAINGREDADIILPTPSREIHFKGRDYVLAFALPNFFFHVTTAYALLRHRGVPVGKLDYLGGA